MTDRVTVGLPHFDGAAVRAALDWPAAIHAVRAVLVAGLDPEAEPARSTCSFGVGQLLMMPASGASSRDGRRLAGVKLATVAPADPDRKLPRIQAVCVLFDADTLAPIATVDGSAVTNLRTAAVSALGVDLLAPADAADLVVFGSGPQARAHVAALRAIRPIRSVGVVGRDPGRAAAFAADLREQGLAARVVGPEAVAGAGLVACCTTARTPLFDGRLLGENAVVVAVGSHEPDAREVDAETVRRCGAAVESVTTATCEAGDIVLALAEGAITVDALVTLADLVRGTAAARPRLIKTVGMGWQDLAVAAAVLETSAVLETKTVFETSEGIIQ